MKYAMVQYGQVRFTWERLFPIFLNLLREPWVIFGFLAYGTSFLFWLKVLSEMELSKAYPMLSLGYPVIFLLSGALFGESLTLAKFLGSALIVSGLAFIAKS